MALDKAKLISDLMAAFSIANQGTSNQTQAINKIADAIDAFVKSGQVTGSCPSGALTNGKVV